MDPRMGGYEGLYTSVYCKGICRMYRHYLCIMNNRIDFRLILALLIGVTSVAAQWDRPLDSPEFPSVDILNHGISDINRLNAVHSNGYRIQNVNEEQKIIDTVPAAIWRGGCLPTTFGMILMYWEQMGFTDIFPHNTTTKFSGVGGAANMQLIASDQNYEDYFYPDDVTTESVVADRSEDPYYLRPPNCIADLFYSSQSYHELRQGATRPGAPELVLPEYIRNRNPNYTIGFSNWNVRSDYWYTNPDPNVDPWDILRREIDAGRPTCMVVDTAGSGLYDHAIVGVGYAIRQGERYYGTLNTWTSSIQWYPWVAHAKDVKWGVAGVSAVNMSHNGPVTSAQFEPARLHKFYQIENGSYFFTASPEEAAAVFNNLPNWKYQGPAFITLGDPKGKGNKPVYRFRNKYANTHFYTITESEKANVIATLSDWYEYEGVAFFGRTDRPKGYKPVYRFWLAKTASHYFTISENEKEYLIRYADPAYIAFEGVAWFAEPLTEEKPWSPVIRFVP